MIPSCPGCGVCTLCKLARKDSRYAKFIGRQVVRALPCVHEGEPVPGYKAEAAGLSHVRKYLECQHPQQPMGAVVCRCKHCKKCPMYQPDVEEADAIIVAN